MYYFIEKKLSSIAAIYARIKCLSEQALEKLDHEHIDITLQQRDTLVHSIRQEVGELHRRHPDWRELARKDAHIRLMMENLHTCITSVIELDGRIGEYLRQRISAIRSELCGLSRTAPAAASYIAHSTMN
ncbi:MAG: hypothetical protein GF398_07250 [Chitinivibrionales bacterium]|nr:hypothetical protein [Chitinivibrionales bacterium]